MSVPWYLMAKGKGGGGYKTASGPIVSINDALAAPLRALTLGIDPVQDLHGYDSPWPAGGGVNLLDISIATALNATYGLTKSIDSSGFVHLDGIVDSTGETLNIAVIRAGDSQIDALTGKNYVISMTDVSGGTIRSAWGLRDIDNGSIACGVINPGNGTELHMKFRVVVATTKQTTFSPYSNLCPISGWSSANLWRTGKNLIDITSPEKDGYYTTDGAYNSAAVYSCYLVPCKPNTTYTVSGNFAGIKTFWDADLNFISGINQGTGETKTFTTPSGALFFRISIFKTDIDGTQQIELSSTPTAYTPYTGNQFTLQLGQTVYGGYIQVGADGSAELVVDAVLEVFNTVGPEGNIISNIGLEFLGTSGSVSDLGDVVRVSMALDANERSKYNLVSSSYDYKMCNMLRHYFNYNDSTAHWYRNTVLYLYFPKSLVGDTVNSVRDYLISIKDTTPLSLWIPLATPITIPLTPQEISTLAGQNVLWADCGEVDVEYLASGGANPDLMKLAVAFFGEEVKR